MRGAAVGDEGRTDGGLVSAVLLCAWKQVLQLVQVFDDLVDDSAYDSLYRHPRHRSPQPGCLASYGRPRTLHDFLPSVAAFHGRTVMSNTSARYRSQVHGSQFIGSRQAPVSPLVPVGLEVQFTSAVEQHDATVRQQYVFLFPLVFGRVVHGFVADSHAPLLQRTSQQKFDELATLLRRNPARNFRNAGAHSAYPPCSASSDRSSWVERAPASRTMTSLVAYGVGPGRRSRSKP